MIMTSAQTAVGADPSRAIKHILDNPWNSYEEKDPNSGPATLFVLSRSAGESAGSFRYILHAIRDAFSDTLMQAPYDPTHRGRTWRGGLPGPFNLASAYCEVFAHSCAL